VKIIVSFSKIWPFNQLHRLAARRRKSPTFAVINHFCFNLKNSVISTITTKGHWM